MFLKVGKRSKTVKFWVGRGGEGGGVYEDYSVVIQGYQGVVVFQFYL